MNLQAKAITVLTTTGEFIVTGDSEGHVKFYDRKLKLLDWYDMPKTTELPSASGDHSLRGIGGNL